MQPLKERMDGFRNELEALQKKWNVGINAEIKTTTNAIIAVPTMIDLVPKKVAGKSEVVKP